MKFYLLFLAIVILSSCKYLDLPSGTPKSIEIKILDLPSGTPKSIEMKIKDISRDGVRNPPASVWQYNYQDQIVYYIPPHCCDIPSELFDANGNLICSPDGGFTGKGDNKCPDFFTTRTEEKLIWKDNR
jgi:hypothetical protein